MDNPTFNSLWYDVSAALVVLGVDVATITKLKTETMDPDKEKHFRELLREWKNDEENIKDQLDRVEGILSSVLDKYRICSNKRPTSN